VMPREAGRIRSEHEDPAPRLGSSRRGHGAGVYVEEGQVVQADGGCDALQCPAMADRPLRSRRARP
jgi:hypothetical protein